MVGAGNSWRGRNPRIRSQGISGARMGNGPVWEKTQKEVVVGVQHCLATQPQRPCPYLGMPYPGTWCPFCQATPVCAHLLTLHSQPHSALSYLPPGAGKPGEDFQTLPGYSFISLGYSIPSPCSGPSGSGILNRELPYSPLHLSVPLPS